MTIITGTANTFVVKSVAVNADRFFKVTVPQANKDIVEYNINSNTEAVHALPISVLCCLIEEKDGLIAPKASLVVAVEPTIEPTSPVVSINAGYTIYISGRVPRA